MDGTSLAIGMVVGAGYLVIPGIVYFNTGGLSIFAWIIDGIIIIPLLMIFAHIGSNHPDAAGLSEYFGKAFGNHAKNAIQALVLITFIFAMPAIALVGSKYAGYFLHVSHLACSLFAILFFIIACCVNLAGLVISSKFQNTLSLTLFLILLIVAFSTIFTAHSTLITKNFNSYDHSITIFKFGAALGTVFFSFIGWEMLSFTSEEFVNPKSDFPKVIFLSYIIVMVLYLTIAISLSINLPNNDDLLLSAPISLLLSNSIGKISAYIICIIAIIIVMANVNSATIAISRLIYAAAKNKILPAKLSIIDRNGIPKHAIIAVSGLFIFIVVLIGYGFIQQATIFKIAGESFFIVYLLTAIAYLYLAKNTKDKCIGSISCLTCITLSISFGHDLIFPLGIFILAITVSRFLTSQHILND